MNRRKPEFLKEGEEPERVYYENVCNKCFSKFNLKKCTRCKKVQYCCKQHQQEDWPFHEKVCSMVAKFEFPKVMDKKEFFFRRWQMLVAMKAHREPNPLTRYEKEICLLPWVCIICFTRDGLNYGCEKCSSVAYCSPDHQKQDEQDHKKLCNKLHLTKIFYSLGYQYGCKVKPIDFKYQPIREKERRFPKEMKDLLKLLQRQLRNPCDDSEAINSGVFTDQYAAAATILSSLETIGVITNRKYNWLPTKSLYQVPDDRPRSRNANAKMSAHLVIHMVAVCEYELQLPWANFVGLLLDWLRNVHYIKIILVGNGLKEFQGFDFESIRHIAGYELHPTLYRDVVDQLEPPDVILIHNFGYPNIESMEELIGVNTKDVLFKYSNVPVIVTAAFPLFLTQLVSCYLSFENVEMLHGVVTNQFCECRAIRFWSNVELQCNHQNEYIAVFKKK